MTFEEAQQLTNKYDKLIGQKALSGQTIVAIVIRRKDEGFEPVAFYYLGTSAGVGEDPLEWYKDSPLSGEKRGFRIYDHEKGKFPWGIISLGDI